MLSPEDIRRRAQSRYADYLRSLAAEAPFFPLPVRFGKPSPTEDFDKLRREINALTKADLNCQIEWTEVNSRRWGKQRLPERVTFADETSYLRTLGKIKEAIRFRENLALTREHCISLVPFMQEQPLEVVEFAESWPGLLEVCCYLQLHPRPNLYARELPLSVDTKFVERHQSILTRLLKIVLPKEAIVETERFEEQFGLRFDEPQVRLRLLDEALHTQLGMPFADFSLPTKQFQKLGWEKLRVFVSENKMTFLTLPNTPRSIAIWGAGNSAALLHEVLWLANCELFYWGDIDVQGFEILARLREAFPRTRSIMMDIETMTRFHGLCRPGVTSKAQIKQQLTDPELQAYKLASNSNLRLEQERIPNQFAVFTLNEAVHTVAAFS